MVPMSPFAPLPSPAPSPARALGLEGVVAAESRLSRVDGRAGQLIIAGLPVAELAHAEGFVGAVDRLQALAQGRARSGRGAQAAALGAARQRAAARLARLPAGGAAPGTTGLGSVRALLPWLVEAEDDADSILGALHVAAAAWLARSAGREPAPPDPASSPAADLLAMAEGARPHPARVAALDAYLVAVVEHGLNASTFAARVVASTQADALGAVVAAMGALSGPLHGGAPGPVLDMLDAVGRPERAAGWVAAELAAGRRIMGMGHRVYRVRDPRAALLEQALGALVAAGPAGGPRGQDRRAVAAAVEAAAVAALARRHPDRPLCANVELATALLLDGLGLPRAAFPVVFACARAAGWLAHATEQRRTGRLLRPRLAYVGPAPQG